MRVLIERKKNKEGNKKKKKERKKKVSCDDARASGGGGSHFARMAVLVVAHSRRTSLSLVSFNVQYIKRQVTFFVCVRV